MTKRDAIRNAYGKVIGYQETASNGDQVVYNSYGKVVARYRASINQTVNAFGKPIGWGNIAVSELFK